MTQYVGRTSEIIRFSSDDQNIWKSGDAAQINWSEYFPIIGGDRSYFTIADLTLTEGQGKLTIDGERIVYDPEGAYEDLSAGETSAIEITYDLVAEDGTRLPRVVEVEARGLTIGTGFVIPETGDASDDVLKFAAADAATILDDPHVFDTLTFIDLGFDTDELLEAGIDGLGQGLRAAKFNLTRAETNLSNAKADYEAAKEASDPFDKATLLAAELALHIAAAEAAEFAYNTAKSASDALDDAELDKAAKQATVTASKITFDAAEGSLEVAEAATVAAVNALSSATSAVSSLIGRINDWIPWWFKEGFNAAAKFLGLDDDLARARNTVTSATNTLSNKEAVEAAVRGEFNDAQAALTVAEREFNAAALDVITKADALTEALAGQTLGALRSARDSTAATREGTEREFNAAQDAVVAATGSSDPLDIAAKAAQLKAAEALAFAEVGLAEADVLAAKGAIAALEVAQDAAEALLDGTDLSLTVETKADVEAQLGFQVDFGLDAGSVDTDIDLKLDTSARFDAVADTLTFFSDAQNATTGESVAFATQGPNFNLYAGFVYDFEAKLSAVLDAFAKLGTFEIFDFPATNAPLTWDSEIQFDGWLDVLDFDNTTLSFDFDWPFGAEWLGKILTISVAAPVIETEGYATEPTEDLFTDPTGFSFDELAGVLADFTNMKLDYSPEFRALLEANGAAKSLDDRDLGEAFQLVAKALFDSIGEEADLNGDGFVPLFLADGSDSGVDGLFHINNIADMPPEDINELGEFGFFYSQGQSNDVLRVTVDLDQLAATVINVAFGNPPATTINPLGMSIDLDDLLGDGKTDTDSSGDASDKDAEAEEKKGLQRYLDFEAGYDILDVDVSAGLNFSQKFALDFHDLEMMLTLEDGGIYTFAPGEDLVIADASTLVDTNGNGQIDYELELTPSSTFYNDTQLGLSLGYQIDMLQVFAEASLGLPFDLLFEDLDWKLPVLSKRLSFGPVLSVKGDIDAVSADIFEDSFAFDIGIGTTAGALPLFAAPLMIAGEGTGGTESELLQGGEVADKIEGGGGSDVVVGGGGVDRLIGDTGGLLDTIEGGQVFRLYQAALGRAPDLGGLKGWFDALSEGGTGLASIAASFINSQEFGIRFGNGGDASFIELLYQNVLERAPNASEVEAWLSRMQEGVERVDVLLGFSNSREFQLNSLAGQAGYAETFSAAAFSDEVFRLYQAALDRAPDLGGFLNWAEQLAQGNVKLHDAASGFIGSTEFQKVFGNLDNAGYVQQLYLNVLDREGTEKEANAWIERIETGALDRADILLGFSNSPEFSRNMVDPLLAWMRAKGADDILDGGPGGDVLSGGLLADTFLFVAGQGGNDRVTDLERWDLISFEGFGFADAQEALAAMRDTEDGVLFDAQGATIEFLGKSLSEIYEDMIAL